MKIEITDCIMKGDQPVYLASVDGGPSKLMSLSELKPHFDNPGDQIIVNIKEGIDRQAGFEPTAR